MAQLPNRYSTNQFYNFNNYEPSGSPTNIGTTDNPAFIWPSAYNKNAVTGNSTPLQRGYIRMLSEAYGTDDDSRRLANRRFHFQFNPDVLTRQVEARNDVQLWMNQDPAQFVNPIPGQANFAFDFILNREAEVASRSYRTSYAGPVRKVKTNTLLPGDTVTPPAVPTGVLGNASRETQQGTYSQSSVVDIGVLADLHVFDQIIGQGLNAEILSKYTNKVIGISNAYNTSVTAGTSGSESTQDAEDAVPKAETIDIKELETFLSGNINNGAFLVSQPVRIVFSSLFMVEGFISSSTVTFNKFNPAMVPTQCTVSVTMNAMYIGFATKNTFLTNSLKASVNTEVDNNNTTNEAYAERSALNQLSNSIFYDVRPRDTGGGGYAAISVKDFFEKNDESTVSWGMFFYTTNAFVDYIKRGLIEGVSGSASLRIVYKGVNGVKTPGTDFEVNEVVYETDSLVTDIVKGPNILNQARFEFDKKVSSATMIWDSNSNAKYEVSVTFTFTMNTNVQSFEALQFANFKGTFQYGQPFTANNVSLHPKPKQG
jgi:hypothetical protein